MIVKKDNLLTALETVKPGLANKEQIEQSTSFAFMGSVVVTYNDELSIACPVEGLDLKGAIQAEQLYNLINKLNNDDISLEERDNELHLKCGKTHAGFTLEKEIKLPLHEINIDKLVRWKPAPENIEKSMYQASFSCSRDMSAPILTCVHVSKKGFIEAADGNRISRYYTDIPKEIESFLIPFTSVQSITKKKIKSIGRGKGWAHFKTEEGVIFSSRVLEDRFPNIDEQGLLKVKGHQVVLPKELEDLLQRAIVFAKRDTKSIPSPFDDTSTITIKGGRIVVEAKSEYGWFKEMMKIDYSGEPVVFSINPFYLKDIIPILQKCTIAKDRIKLEGENWEFIAALASEED